MQRSTLTFVPITRHYENSLNTEADIVRGDCGFDLYVAGETILEPMQVTMIKYGLRAAMYKGDPEEGHRIGYILAARSSISKYGGIFMTNGVGLIDKNYTGELMSAIFNPTTAPIVISDGTKFAQIFDPTTMTRPHTIRVESLTDTIRGEGGFGSTGY